MGPIISPVQQLLFIIIIKRKHHISNIWCRFLHADGAVWCLFSEETLLALAMVVAGPEDSWRGKMDDSFHLWRNKNSRINNLVVVVSSTLKEKGIIKDIMEIMVILTGKKSILWWQIYTIGVENKI